MNPTTHPTSGDPDITRLEHQARAHHAAGNRLTAAETEYKLGSLYARRARFLDAEHAYTTARQTCADFGYSDNVAACDHGLGNVYRATGRNDQAEHAYTAARQICTDLRQPDAVADCDVGLGNVYENTGRYEEADQAYSNARQTYTDLRQLDKVAVCENNLGNVYKNTGRFEQAEQAYTHARQAYANLGRWVEAARCDVSRAMTRRSVAGAMAIAMGPPAPRLLREVLDLQVTAALALNTVRFQFPTAQVREAWMATEDVSHSLRSAFALAAELGDARLIAELVEVSLNVGVHTATGPDPLSSGARPASSAPPRDPAETAVSSRTEPWNIPLQPDPEAGPAVRLAAGAARLLTGAVLPLAPPPQLQMPDGRIALDHYRQLAETRYRITAHTNQIIPTW